MSSFLILTTEKENMMLHVSCFLVSYLGTRHFSSSTTYREEFVTWVIELRTLTILLRHFWQH